VVGDGVGGEGVVPVVLQLQPSGCSVFIHIA